MGDSPIIIYKVTIVERASDGTKAKREKNKFSDVVTFQTNYT